MLSGLDSKRVIQEKLLGDKLKVDSIGEVVRAQLCTGCGACAYIAPGRYRMGDTLEHGRRPFLQNSPASEVSDVILVCPGIHLAHQPDMRHIEGINQDLLDGWGPVLAVWEGYAVDPEIRFSGSSGGAITALALYCIEREGMSGALHSGARDDKPYLNETVYSTCRADLLARAGSRYSPASPCEGLMNIENAPGKSIFIGKPCDVAAAQNSRKLRKCLDEKIGVTIALFCAGTPSTKGTLDLLKAIEVEDYDLVKELRYRGNGWPGKWTAKFISKEGEEKTKQMSYEESWGFLQKYRQWRCYICPDHTGEFADIALGDPWFRKAECGDNGRSLIVARSKRGKDIVLAAAASGYLKLESNSDEMLPRSQPNLIKSRGILWARLKVLGLLAVPVPKYLGFTMFKFWLTEVRIQEKIQSIFGTVKRIYTKGLHNPIVLKEWPGDKR